MSDNIVIEQLTDRLAHIRHLIDMDIHGDCMTEGCAQPAGYQIRALEIRRAAHDKPVLLCEKCLKRARLKVDADKWEAAYSKWQGVG